MARGSVVVIFSDGWDRGDPTVLADQNRFRDLSVRHSELAPVVAAFHEFCQRRVRETT